MSKSSVNLPKTSFSMRANLPLKEPDLIIGTKYHFMKSFVQTVKETKNLFYMMAHLMQMEISTWELL